VKLLFVLVVILSTGAHADDLSIRKHLINGQEYLCFDTDKSNSLNYSIEQKDKLIKIQADRLVTKDAIITKMKEISLIQVQQLKIIQAENRDLTDKLKKSDAWYKSPYFWFPVGIVVGGGIAIGVAQGV
jgi:hypothetical protein